MKNAIIEKIIAYFEENEEIFNACIEELDCYNGFLGDDRYYDMEELDDLMSGKSVSDLLNMAYFGRDDENWHTDSLGNKIYDSFNPNRNYFYFNGYGNLVSADYVGYSEFLCGSAVETLSRHRQYIDSIEEDDELSAMFDELEAVQHA
ncbi:MAG: hypothetical protein II264_04535 [Ruminococcus sp.]|nr:hypothetical protein [Ruminococcus sp.]